MFKLIFCLLILTVVVESFTEYSDLSMKQLERALENNEISLDELFAELGSNDEDNEISQLNPLPNRPGNRLEGEICDNRPGEICNLKFHREPDFDFTPEQMIEYRGFKYEAHHVVTEDCFVLEMHRIVNPYDITPNKPPVLLQHGLMDSSSGWMINTITGRIDDEDDRNLAFALAKRGYDVWMGNYRGNTYSKNHTTFSTRDPEFWKFTFDNHALQDLPAQIAHVQKVTNYDQIAYVGFSQGTLTMFELLSFKPEVAKAIRVYIALAPVAYIGAAPSPLRFLAFSERLMRRLMYHNIEFLPNSWYNKIFSAVACPLFPGLICKNALYLICGFSTKQLNGTRLPVFFNHLPAGTSLPNLVHFGQMMRSKEVALLDYMSPEKNLKCYNSVRPPRVPLEKIALNDLHLFNSLNDLLADPKDVDRLKAALKVKFESKTVEIKRFSHVDFILSERADYYVNDYVIKVLQAKVPTMSVDEKARVRLKTFDESTCVVPKRDFCHLNLQHTLRNII